MTPSSQPNAKQKRWREAVRDLGSVVSGGPAVIHHAVGRTAKHNKVAIGHEFILPLTDEEHKALHNGETFGYESRKQFEKWAYSVVRNNVKCATEDLPSAQVDLAIMDYRR